jgi:hypothetical protein
MTFELLIYGDFYPNLHLSVHIYWSHHICAEYSVSRACRQANLVCTWNTFYFMIIWTGVSFSILFHPFREEIVYSSHNETDDRADRVNSARISEMDRLIESISMWYSSMGLRCSHFSLLNPPTVTFNSNRSVLLCYTSRTKSTVSLNLAQKCVQSVDTINGQPHVCSII